MHQMASRLQQKETDAEDSRLRGSVDIGRWAVAGLSDWLASWYPNLVTTVLYNAIELSEPTAKV
jgi:hypothetical protein